MSPILMEVARATGKWCSSNVPHKGWQCVMVEDLGEQRTICEMCEVMEIRYVHYMEHPDHPETLGCGCVCAEHMSEDYEGPRRREAALKNAAARRKNWLKRQWNVSAKGNAFLRTDGFVITIFPKNAKWSASILEGITERTRYASRLYDTVDEAKLAAFDAMISMKDK